MNALFPMKGSEILSIVNMYHRAASSPQTQYVIRVGVLETLRKVPSHIIKKEGYPGISARDFFEVLPSILDLLQVSGNEVLGDADKWRERNNDLREKARGVLIFTYLDLVLNATELSRSELARSSGRHIPNATKMKKVVESLLRFFGESSEHSEAGKNGRDLVQKFLRCVGLTFVKDWHFLRDVNYGKTVATSRYYRLFLEEQFQHVLLSGIPSLFQMTNLELQEVGKKAFTSSLALSDWWSEYDFLMCPRVRDDRRRKVLEEIHQIQAHIMRVQEYVLPNFRDGGYGSSLDECVRTLSCALGNVQRSVQQ